MERKESGLLHEKIPKNLLLPIVENSFYHGLSNKDDFFSGNIDISSALGYGTTCSIVIPFHSKEMQL